MITFLGREALWSPYYKIGVRQSGDETIIDVNNTFHQSMAPLAHKEYFYEWPYVAVWRHLRRCACISAPDREPMSRRR